MGDEAAARKHYQDSSAFWKNADPDIPVLIEFCEQTFRFDQVGSGCPDRPGRFSRDKVPPSISRAAPGQKVGVREVDDKIWLVNFKQYGPGYFDPDTCRLELIANPFASRVPDDGAICWRTAG